MQKPQYILDFTNICQQYIYIYKLNIIWTVCWAMRTFRATDFRPRELCLPDNYVWKLLSLGSALTETAMKILYLVCYAGMFFYPTKKCLTEYDRMYLLEKQLFFHDFHDPLWLWVMATWGCPNKSRWRTLSPEASVSGRDYCAARGRSCVKSTVRIPWERAEIQGACADGFAGY